MRRGGDDVMCKDKKWWPDYKCGGGGKNKQRKKPKKAEEAQRSRLKKKATRPAHSVNCFVWRTTAALLRRIVLSSSCSVLCV
jgi:hypothetical protein